MTLNMLTSRMDKQSQSTNVACATQVLYGNPDLDDRVFHLYAGPEYPAPPPTYPPRPVSDPVELDPLSPTQRIDMAKLESICTHNNFSPMPLQPHDPFTPISAPGIDSSTALYTYTSMFNHSCSPNANYIFLGNVIVIRASCSIKAGQEVTIAYISPHQPYTERRDTLATAWHLPAVCDCAQCQDDRVDGAANLRHREEILATLSGGLLRRPLEELQALEKKLSATYAPTRGPRRLAMYNVHHVIAEHLRASYSMAAMNRAIQEDIKALECLGLTVLKGAPARSVSRSKSKKRRDVELMVEVDHLGYVPEEAIAPMLRIAQSYIFFDDLTNILGWLKTAQWGKHNPGTTL